MTEVTTAEAGATVADAPAPAEAGDETQEQRGVRRPREPEDDGAGAAEAMVGGGSIAALGQEIANEMAAAAAVSPPLSVQDVALPPPATLPTAPGTASGGKGQGRGRKRQNVGDPAQGPSVSPGAWSAAAAASAPPKSELTLLCERFQRRYGRLGPDGLPRVLLLNDVAASLDVPRRRLYDVINVFEAIEAMRRVGKLTYEFVGFSHLPSLLTKLLDEELKGLPVDDRPRRATPVGGVGSPEPAEPVGGPASQQKPSSHSLWVLSRRLVRMLLNHAGPITLAAAAAILVGPSPPAAEGAPPRSQTQITVERRLYDISSILCSIGLIQRVYVKKRQPAFEWIYGWRPGDAHAPPPLALPGDPEPEGATGPDGAPSSLPILPPPSLAYPPPLSGLLPTLTVQPGRQGTGQPGDGLAPGQADGLAQGGDAAAAAAAAAVAMQAMQARAQQVLQLQHLQASLAAPQQGADGGAAAGDAAAKQHSDALAGLVPSGDGSAAEGSHEAQVAAAAAAAAAAQAAINAAMLNPGAFMTAGPGDGSAGADGSGQGAGQDAAAASLAAAANASLLMWAPHLFFSPGMFGMGFPGMPGAPGAVAGAGVPGAEGEGGVAGAAGAEGADGAQGAADTAAGNPAALPLSLPPGYQFSPFGPGGLLPMVPPLMLPPAPALVNQKKEDEASDALSAGAAQEADAAAGAAQEAAVVAAPQAAAEVPQTS